MAEVRRLAREPVETIFAGVPVGRISDADYRTAVHDSPRPVVVIFYANQDEKSRNLATLARYLALEFSQVITLHGIRVTAGSRSSARRSPGFRRSTGSGRSRPPCSTTTIGARSA